MKTFIQLLYLIFISQMIICQIVVGQTDSMANINMFQSSVQDLMKLPLGSSSEQEIISASKKAENIFDAPLSATVITKEDLKASGVTSLAEAMRLVPGMMVRETSNGNFEAHIRGTEYAPAYHPFINAANRTTLVMIDGRPVYNHLNGGVFWETLPIDINDVERIEVIRGPSAPLYGANAVTGVIHFITRKKADAKDYQVVANMQRGNYKSTLLNTFLTSKISNRLNISTSWNFTHKNRTDDQYYSRRSGKYIGASELNYSSFQPRFIYPDTLLALEKYAGNLSFDYQLNKKVDVSLKGGFQKAQAHKIFSNNQVSNLIYTFSESQYIDFTANVHQLKTQYSYWWGEIDERSIQSVYKFEVHDATIEYDIEQINRLRISPFVSFRSVNYQEMNAPNRIKLFNNESPKANNYGGGIKLDYAASQKIRLIGAIRAEYFDISGDTYLSFQTIATYKPSEKNIFRVLYGRSNIGAFMYDTRLSFGYSFPSPIPGFQTYSTNTQGNEDLKLQIQDLIELGYRAKITDDISLDWEIFGLYVV
jgi:iron complex outermembrane recepter protein